jgi:hypothetical protein
MVLSWAEATPTAAKATVAIKDLMNTRFMGFLQK